MTGAILWLVAALSWTLAGETEHRIEVEPGVTIRATLSIPEAEVTHAALLLPVAGPTDRDLSLGSRGIYRAVAERLRAAGIATLRIADRGVDGSEGDWRRTDLETRIADAIRAFRWLVRRPEVEGASFGALGLSEGGALALAVTTRNASADFLVMLSTPLLPGVAHLRAQRDRALEGSALSEEQRALMTRESERLLAAAISKDTAEARSVLGGPAGALVLPPYGFVPSDIDDRVAFVLSPWYRSQVRYDIDAIGLPRTRVFLAYGELDAVLDGPFHAERAQTWLGEREGSIRLVPGTNHLLMPAITGSPLEYATLPELLHAELWVDIVGWILGR